MGAGSRRGPRTAGSPRSPRGLPHAGAEPARPSPGAASRVRVPLLLTSRAQRLPRGAASPRPPGHATFPRPPPQKGPSHPPAPCPALACGRHSHTCLPGVAGPEATVTDDHGLRGFKPLPALEAGSLGSGVTRARFPWRPQGRALPPLPQLPARPAALGSRLPLSSLCLRLPTASPPPLRLNVPLFDEDPTLLLGPSHNPA